jgi:hypothetical protein
MAMRRQGRASRERVAKGGPGWTPRIGPPGIVLDRIVGEENHA